MSTSLSSSLSLPADTQTAFAMVTNRDYLQRVAAATGGTDVEITVTPTIEGGATIVSRRKLPAELPSYAKALVGDFLKLTETRSFGPAAEGAAGAEGFDDDLPFARLVAQRLHAPLHVVSSDPGRLEALDELVRTLDEPTPVRPAACAALRVMLSRTRPSPSLAMMSTVTGLPCP